MEAEDRLRDNMSGKECLSRQPQNLQAMARPKCHPLRTQTEIEQNQTRFTKIISSEKFSLQSKLISRERYYLTC